ncbi:MAG: PepSY-associated TM helix domain-containing protein [Sphingomonadaceae bacterium]
MRFSLFRFCRTCHAWGGAALALLILLISLTGTLLVWKQEYLKWDLPQAHADFVPSAEALALIATAAQAQFGRNTIARIDFATEDFALSKVFLSDSSFAYLDPQGRLVGHWALNARFEDWLYDLHHRLLLGKTGLMIAGLSGLLMALLVMVGVIAFWPLRHGWRQGFRPRSSAPSSLRASHRNIGIVEALPLLFTLLTGVTLTFPEQTQQWLIEPLRGAGYGAQFSEHLDGVSGNETAQWLPVMRRAMATFPGAVIRSAQVPGDFSPYRIIGLQQPGEIDPQGLSKVYIAASGGYMDVRMDARTYLLSERVLMASQALHTVRFHALWYRLLLTASGMLIMYLCVIGLLSFSKSWRRPRFRQKSL